MDIAHGWYMHRTKQGPLLSFPTLAEKRPADKRFCEMSIPAYLTVISSFFCRTPFLKSFARIAFFVGGCTMLTLNTLPGPAPFASGQLHGTSISPLLSPAAHPT
jgi:hypothetical protein